MIAAHVPGVRLEGELPATRKFNQPRSRRKDPTQVVRACRGVEQLQPQSAQQHHHQLCAPFGFVVHTSCRRRRRIITVINKTEPTINHTSSGSLPVSVPPTAMSLTLIGNGSGWFMSLAGSRLLVTTSRTAMNDVYCVSKLYFKPSEVISLALSSDTFDAP